MFLIREKLFDGQAKGNGDTSGAPEKSNWRTLQPRRPGEIDLGTDHVCADSDGSFRRWHGRDAFAHALPRSAPTARPARSEWPAKARLRSPSDRSPRIPAARAVRCTRRATCLSVSRSEETRPFARDRAEQRAVCDPAERASTSRAERRGRCRGASRDRSRPRASPSCR